MYVAISGSQNGGVDGYHSTVSDGFAALHKVHKEQAQSPILLSVTFHAVALSLSQESIPMVTSGFALVVTPRGREMPRLNASFVKTTKAVGRFGDGRGGYGLALLVRPRAGGGVRKSWTQRVRVGGRATNLGLGQYPLVELAEARAKALENARAVAAGRDPRTSAAPTFEEAAQEVIRLRIPVGAGNCVVARFTSQITTSQPATHDARSRSLWRRWSRCSQASNGTAARPKRCSCAPTGFLALTATTSTSKSSKRPAVTDSSTSTAMPPDQPRHSFRHPHLKAQAPDLGVSNSRIPHFSRLPRPSLTRSEGLVLWRRADVVDREDAVGLAPQDHQFFVRAAYVDPPHAATFDPHPP